MRTNDRDGLGRDRRREIEARDRALRRATIAFWIWMATASIVVVALALAGWLSAIWQ